MIYLMKRVPWNRYTAIGTLFLCGLVFADTVAAAVPSTEQMWEMIQQQQQVIEDLKKRIEATERQAANREQRVKAAEKKVDETEAKLAMTADAIDEVTTQRETLVKRTSIGGYGELHYNNLNDDNDAIGGDDDLNQVDFHRFVLYFGHEFTDSIRFFSELEVEHAVTKDTADGSGAGEVELEQAWLELDINDRHSFRAGLDILPIGILNPTHEPNTFYGVERNRVETEIIPATWWEALAGAHGELAPGWNYDLFVHSGLVAPTGGSSAFRPRSGRLKLAKAKDQDIAVTGRLRYTGLPGLELGISGQYQADYTGTADAFDIDATLFVGHVDWKHASGLGLRALYARWDIGSDDGLDPGAFNADNLAGWYIEPAYRFPLPGGLGPLGGEMGVFVRYSEWDERNKIGGAHKFEDFEQFTVGFNWWPHANVVFKFDAQFEDADGPVDALLDGFNLGMGYQF